MTKRMFKMSVHQKKGNWQVILCFFFVCVLNATRQSQKSSIRCGRESVTQMPSRKEATDTNCDKTHFTCNVWMTNTLQHCQMAFKSEYKSVKYQKEWSTIQFDVNNLKPVVSNHTHTHSHSTDHYLCLLLVRLEKKQKKNLLFWNENWK